MCIYGDFVEECRVYGVEGQLSHTPVTSDVPQGSVLGPLLLSVIFLNGCPGILYVCLLMIASFTERFVQQQIPSSFSMISINLLPGNNHG